MCLICWVLLCVCHMEWSQKFRFTPGAKSCGARKGPDFEASITVSRVLPTFPGWLTRYLTRRAWHIQLWHAEQSRYVRLTQQCCMAAHLWFITIYSMVNQGRFQLQSKIQAIRQSFEKIWNNNCNANVWTLVAIFDYQIKLGVHSVFLLSYG